MLQIPREPSALGRPAIKCKKSFGVMYGRLIGRLAVCTALKRSKSAMVTAHGKDPAN